MGEIKALEWNVQDRVLRPVFVVEVPPLGGINGKALAFHGSAKQIAAGAGFGVATGVVRIGALGKFVVAAGHLSFAAGLEVVKTDVRGAAAIVFGAFAWISDEFDFALFWRGRIPERLCH